VPPRLPNSTEELPAHAGFVILYLRNTGTGLSRLWDWKIPPATPGAPKRYLTVLPFSSSSPVTMRHPRAIPLNALSRRF
jgi:hypothetical protein